jgi:hypothetical protein
MDEVADMAKLTQDEEEIRTLIGTPTCTCAGDARYIAFGTKPCGGPWLYLIYSTVDTDTLLLTRKVQAYNRFNARLNRKYGWTSDCSVPSPPVVGCQAGRCVDLSGAT